MKIVTTTPEPVKSVHGGWCGCAACVIDPPRTAAQAELGRIGFALGTAVGVAINGRSTAYAGHTLGSFIAALRKLGVRDEDVLVAVDFGTRPRGSGYIYQERDEFGGVFVREVR